MPLKNTAFYMHLPVRDRVANAYAKEAPLLKKEPLLQKRFAGTLQYGNGRYGADCAVQFFAEPVWDSPARLAVHIAALLGAAVASHCSGRAGRYTSILSLLPMPCAARPAFLSMSACISWPLLMLPLITAAAMLA